MEAGTSSHSRATNGPPMFALNPESPAQVRILLRLLCSSAVAVVLPFARRVIAPRIASVLQASSMPSTGLPLEKHKKRVKYVGTGPSRFVGPNIFPKVFFEHSAHICRCCRLRRLLISHLCSLSQLQSMSIEPRKALVEPISTSICISLDPLSSLISASAQV
jgi:hypothetical protein